MDYDLAPEYDWIEIAEDLGEQLNLVDYGNGNYSGSYTYSSESIDLPFIFTFYGIDYETVVFGEKFSGSSLKRITDNG